MDKAKDLCRVYQCTQCGKIERKPFLATPHEMLSCECEKRMPWKWIPTREWYEAYHRQRRKLGIE